MDLLAMQMEENRRKLKTTVLYREDGTWLKVEVSRLVTCLITEVSQHPKHPEYLVLFGHYTKEKISEAIIGGLAYITLQVTGVDELPFNPGFI